MADRFHVGDKPSCSLKIIGYFLASVYITIRCIAYGAIVQILWLWFVAQKFGLPPVSLPEGIGLGLLAGFLTSQFVPFKLDPLDLLKTFGKYELALFGGTWIIAIIVHAFM